MSSKNFGETKKGGVIREKSIKPLGFKIQLVTDHD